MSPTDSTFHKDPEKAAAPEDPVARGTATEAWDTEPAAKEPWQRRFVDSFKRDPNAHVIKPGQTVDPHAGHGFDHKTAAERTANSGLAHKLKSRHMQMVSGQCETFLGLILLLLFCFLKLRDHHFISHLNFAQHHANRLSRSQLVVPLVSIIKSVRVWLIEADQI